LAAYRRLTHQLRIHIVDSIHVFILSILLILSKFPFFNFMNTAKRFAFSFLSGDNDFQNLRSIAGLWSASIFPPFFVVSLHGRFLHWAGQLLPVAEANLVKTPVKQGFYAVAQALLCMFLNECQSLSSCRGAERQ
jgi:hypothetical protein